MSAILTWHSIDASGSPISTSPALFAEQLAALKESGTPVVRLEDVAIHRNAVALTFDDGYANFAEHAAPLLAAHGFPVTVFLVTGRMGQLNDWDRAPRLALMSWDDARRLAGHSVRFGAHTQTHADLSLMSHASVEAELRESAAQLRTVTGEERPAFAYPYGRLNAAVKASAARHFRLACGTRLNYLHPADSLYDLPRLDCFYLRDPRRFRELFSPAVRRYMALRRLAREVRAWRFR